MILLDTDHISVLQWEGEAAERLRRRMADSTDEWLGITSITLEEQTRAAISRLGQSKTTHSQVKYYALLVDQRIDSGTDDRSGKHDDWLWQFLESKQNQNRDQ